MDFLSRYVARCALACALCLVSIPAFAVLDSPNYSWKLSSSGNVYRVYDPQGGRASATFSPGSAFAEGPSSGVVETLAPSPLLIDGATGDVIASLSRSLTVGDLVGGLTDAMSGPLGASIIAASNLLPFLQSLYNQYESSSSPSSSYVPSPNYYCGSTAMTAPSGLDWEPDGTYCFNGDTAVCGGGNGCFGGPNTYFCSANNVAPVEDAPPCSNGATPSVDPNGATSVPPSNLPQWAANNWTSDNLANDATSVLNSNPSYSPTLASNLANNNAPLSSPVPYFYSPSSNTLSGPSSTSSSTDPSTGTTTTTTSTPSYKVSPGTNGGLNVTKNTTVVTQSCTSAGSCTVTNTTTESATPKSTPFVAPTTSVPPSNTSSIKSFALNLAMPSQSNAVCPSPLSFNAFSNTFTIPLSPLCTLATDVRPYVESLGAVGAGIVIFR